MIIPDVMILGAVNVNGEPEEVALSVDGEQMTLKRGKCLTYSHGDEERTVCWKGMEGSTAVIEIKGQVRLGVPDGS